MLWSSFDKYSIHPDCPLEDCPVERVCKWPPMQTGEPPEPGDYLIKVSHTATKFIRWWTGEQWWADYTVLGWWELPKESE